jgi:hypothetical protein
MKVIQILLLLIALIAFCNAAATGATGSSEPSKAEEAKVEKEKKNEMEHKVEGMKKEKTAEIKKIVDTAIAETNKYAGDQKTACNTEESEAKQWSKEADPAAAEKNRLERKKAKEALLAAIEYRQKILKKFLDKLYAARFTLGDSIHRTNNIYFAAYDANVNTQVITREVLAKLGIVFEAKLKKSGGSLGVFTPIKLPNIHDDEVEEEKEEKKAGLTDITGATGSATGGAAAATTLMEIKSMEQHNRDMIRQSLMEVAAQVHKKMVKCVGEECDPAMQEAWILHQEAFDVDCANYKVYDVEQRTPLALYREGLKHLIKVREEKLKALEKQAAELRASLADPGQTLAELFPLIDQHIKIQDVACKKMPINTEKVLKELKSMQADIAAGKFSCEIEGGEKDISATGSADDKDAKAEAAKTAAVAKETEAAASSGPADKKEEDKTPSAASSGPAEKKTTTDESKSSSSGATGSTGITNSVEEVFDGQAQ